MNTFTQHIPTYIEGTPNTHMFYTTNDLLSLSDVACWKNLKGFTRFSKSGNLLMVEIDNGDIWWVAGYLKDPESVDLPEWRYKKKK